MGQVLGVGELFSKVVLPDSQTLPLKPSTYFGHGLHFSWLVALSNLNKAESQLASGMVAFLHLRGKK